MIDEPAYAMRRCRGGVMLKDEDKVAAIFWVCMTVLLLVLIVALTASNIWGTYGR